MPHAKFRVTSSLQVFLRDYSRDKDRPTGGDVERAASALRPAAAEVQSHTKARLRLEVALSASPSADTVVELGNAVPPANTASPRLPLSFHGVFHARRPTGEPRRL